MAGSTRRIHTAGGPLDIVVDNNSTAGDFGLWLDHIAYFSFKQNLVLSTKNS